MMINRQKTLLTTIAGLLAAAFFGPALAGSRGDQEMSSSVSCSGCTSLVTSFIGGIEKTKRGKLEGGDTAWEEKNKIKYATSQVRFVEITEDLCRDVTSGRYQCEDALAEAEDSLEDWWSKEPETRPDLFQYLCVDELATCCPRDRYGPKCQGICDNIGVNGKLCSGRGKCRGGGTRLESGGGCVCDKGYKGITCDTCDKMYFASDWEVVELSEADSQEEQKNEKLPVCTSCHKSCDDGCSGATNSDCFRCKKGYRSEESVGCQDIDECSKLTRACPEDKFCTNTEGSFKCDVCHQACKGCEGPGPAKCRACAVGYHMTDSGACTKTTSAGTDDHEDAVKKLFVTIVVALAFIFVLKRIGAATHFTSGAVVILIVLSIKWWWDGVLV